ncbi:MAG: hypothetical protein IKH75_18310 [Ruminococcus sp.]|nr:hypothetical protein [Ruminococcus sp.]
MGLFAKPEYETVILDYRAAVTDDFPCIEAYGDVFGQTKYCNACYGLKDLSMYDDGRFDKLMNDLKNSQGRLRIGVDIKMKNGSPVDFKIDLEHLAETVGNPDITKLELIGWGFNDEPDPDFLK